MAEIRRSRLATNDENENDARQQIANNNEPRMNCDEMINRLKREMSEQNDYPFLPCDYRNIVLIGRIRTGKSSISDMLPNPFHIPALPGLFASTREIRFNRITTTHQNRNYFFTIIDSPGLYDTVINEGERLDNKTIKNYLDQCITKDITHIHAFAFVVSSAGGINNQDIESMILIQRHYRTLNRFFMLIITHCEEKNEEERRIFIDEFFQHPQVIGHRLRDFFGLGVFFTGCLRPQLGRNPNLIAARIQAKNILEMRTKLLDFLVSKEDTFNIHRDSSRSSWVEYIRTTSPYIPAGFSVLFVVVAIIWKRYS